MTYICLQTAVTGLNVSALLDQYLIELAPEFLFIPERGPLGWAYGQCLILCQETWSQTPCLNMVYYKLPNVSTTCT